MKTFERSRHNRHRLAAALTTMAVGALLAVAPASAVAAKAPIPLPLDDANLPGMCSGPSDPGVRVSARAFGPEKADQYVLGVSTNAAGRPRGTMVLARGPVQLQVSHICRVWLHVPGQQPHGPADDDPESATTAHAVGLTELADGTPVMVRTDVRETEEGQFFRVWYRPLTSHDHEVAGHEEDEHDDESWVRVPEEGWAPLDRLSVRAMVG